MSQESGESIMFMAEFDDDPRAGLDISKMQTVAWDFDMGQEWNFTTGVTKDGDNYGIGINMVGTQNISWTYMKNVSLYPSLQPAGPMMEGATLYKMYSLRPDTPYSAGGNGSPAGLWPIPFGDGGQYDIWNSMGGYMIDTGSTLNPTAPSSRYLNWWFNNVIAAAPSRSLANLYVNIGSWPAENMIKFPTPITPSASTVQPTQYFFGTTGYSLCATLTAYACNPAVSATNFYSRTGWTHNYDTHIMFESRTFSGSSHDVAAPWNMTVYKLGYLLGDDAQPTQFEAQTEDIVGFSPQFGPSPSVTAPFATILPLRWASANHGSWDTQYGDQNSEYMYAMEDGAGAYNVTYNRVQRHLVHFKKSGLEEKVVTYDDIDATGHSNSIAIHLHYPQNGEPAPSDTSNVAYNEGTTTFTGASLNVGKQVVEQQTGAMQYYIINLFPPTYGNPTIFTTQGNSGFTSGSVIISGIVGTGTGCSALNGTFTGTYISPNSFSIPLNSTSYTCSLSSWGTEQVQAGATQYNLISNFIIPSGAPTTFLNVDTPWISYSAVTPGNPTIITAAGHGLTNGQSVAIQGGTGSWVAANNPSGYGTNPWTVTVIDSSHFSIPLNSTGFSGSFAGTIQVMYPGAFGHTYRISACADASNTGACGATGQNGMELITAHKIATQPDVTLNTTAINPDSNWTGVQYNDATDSGGAVAVFARHGVTQSTITSFTTTHAGTAQYLIAGLTPGTYSVTVGGSPISACNGASGNTCAVSAGDNSAYFSSKAGTVVITTGVQAASGSAISSGTVITPVIRH